MAKKNPRIDAYIASAAPFAQPILKHLRKVVHTGCPAVKETIKWKMPLFDYKGLFIGMAAFKQHCSFGFLREASLALDGRGEASEGMGQFGKITTLGDLPDEKMLIGYVRKAVKIKDAGVKLPAQPKPKSAHAAIETPNYLAHALRHNAAARNTWDGFTASHRKEYITWLTEAKREETREKRLEKALAQLAKGNR